MKAIVEIKIKPFTVPDFVLAAEQHPRERQEGFNQGCRYALNDLDAEALEALCRKFKQDVFAKAGKQMPPTVI